MAFAAAATIAPLYMVFGCGVVVDTLSYGSVLLEESLAFMGSIEDQREMAPHTTLVRHSQDPHPLWRDSAELFWQCEHIVLSLASTTLVIPDSPSTLAHHILWRPPNVGITLVELFGGIGTGLVAVLELASQSDGMFMWTTFKWSSVWLVTIFTSRWCCTDNSYTRLPFVGVFHVSLVMSHSSVRPIYDTWVRWIW